MLNSYLPFAISSCLRATGTDCSTGSSDSAKKRVVLRILIKPEYMIMKLICGALPSGAPGLIVRKR